MQRQQAFVLSLSVMVLWTFRAEGRVHWVPLLLRGIFLLVLPSKILSKQTHSPADQGFFYDQRIFSLLLFKVLVWAVNIIRLDSFC